MAVRYDVTADQGATLHLTFLWRQPSVNDTPGNPVNLDGYTARMHLRTQITDPEPALELTTDNGRIILGAADPDTAADPTTGLITLWVDADTTTTLDAGTYVYDLELVAGTHVTRFIEGKVKLRPEVTR